MIAVLFFLTIDSEADILDFEFENSHGTIYRTIELVDQLRKEYNYEFVKATLVLIETASLKESKFIRQMEILDSLEHGTAEDLQLMYVISCVSEEYRDGYHTTTHTANRLNSNKNTFRVRLLTSSGNVFHSSYKPISAEQLRHMVENKFGIDK